MYKIDFFPELSEEAKCLLLNIARIKEYRRKDYLLREGQVCKRLYFIQTGLLRTFYNNTGKDINLHFATEGQFSTDIKSLRRQIPSELWIQAYEPTTVLEFDSGTLLSLYTRSEEIRDIGHKLMAQLQQEQLEHADLINLLSPNDRYLYLQRRRPDLIRRISLTHLSSYIGISRETLSRLRNP